MVQAADFAFDKAALRNDIGAGTAADFSDVGCGALCHVALRKLCDCTCSRLDAVDAVLRVKTCMGGFSLDFCFKRYKGRSCIGCRADCSAQVQNVRFFCLHLAVIEGIRTFAVQLLTG